MNDISARFESSAASDVDGLIYGAGSPLVEIKRSCLRIASSDATVMLTGETGTGKEVFARFVHNHSPRSARQFVPVNCGAIPESLLESELFGFVKGAFTGAVSARRGRVALAEGGTLFLDEIGELPLSLQVKLLRLLQERTYEPVGSSESVHANFRLVAATNRNLFSEVRAGRFRRDLFYRLNVCPVRLPALRERPGDIQALFSHFWSRRGEQRPLESSLMTCFQQYPWPGNVRELENIAERLSVCAEGPVILRSDVEGALLADDEIDLPSLPPVTVRPLAPEATPTPATNVVSMASYRVETAPVVAAAPAVVAAPTPAVVAAPTLAPLTNDALPPIQLPIDMPRLFRDLEDAFIRTALAQTNGNRKEAAALLGMGRTTLVEKLRRRNGDAVQTPAATSVATDVDAS